MTEQYNYYSFNSDQVFVEGHHEIEQHHILRSTDVLDYMSNIMVSLPEKRRRVRFFDCDREIVVLLKVSKHKILEHVVCAIGTRDTVYLDQSMFYHALHKRVKGEDADGFILAHNHPNAQYVPSNQDKFLTSTMMMLEILSGKLFIEHYIVGPTTKVLNDKWVNCYKFNKMKVIDGQPKYDFTELRVNVNNVMQQMCVCS